SPILILAKQDTPLWQAAGGPSRITTVRTSGGHQGVSRTDSASWVYCFMASVLDLIGETPLIEVTKFDRGSCRLFLKLESANPSGSIKDRPARAMIEAAEA